MAAWPWLRNLCFSVFTASRPFIRANGCRLSYCFHPKPIHKLTLNQTLISRMDRPEIRVDCALSGKAGEKEVPSGEQFAECGKTLEQGTAGFRSAEGKRDEEGVVGKDADSPPQRYVNLGLPADATGLKGRVEGSAEILLKDREEAVGGEKLEEESVRTKRVGKEDGGRAGEGFSGECSTDLGQDSDQEGGGDGEREAGTEDLATKLSGDERYRYIKRGFTSEIYKIEIRNLPKYMGYTDLKKHLQKLGLKPVKIRKPQSSQKHSYCFVNFPSEEDREAALRVLDGHVWKNRTLSVKVAAPAVDPLYKQRKKAKREASTGDGDESSAKRPRLDSDESLSLEERLDKAVTPLLHTPYDTQLATKTSQMSQVLQKAAYLIQKGDANPGAEFADQVKRNNGMMCQLKPTLPSPLQRGYRNKVEFSIGVTDEGKPVVGFRLGSYEAGNFTVVSAETCAHIPQKMKDLSKVFQEFFSLSPLPPYVSADESGNWRQVAVRCYDTGETMAVVMLHPQQLPQEDIAREKRRLVEFFTSGSGASSGLTSLYFQSFSRRAKDHIPEVEHILGEKHVHESILGLTFRISPDAFFQTNTLATEVLYKQVREFCSPSSSSSSSSSPSSSTSQLPTVYDICCGTGTIGLYLAKALPARWVVGVEMNEQAVEDAKANAKLNSILNAEFICGKAEDVLPKQLEDYGANMGEIIGVVDPPRGGLHPRVVQCIRRCSHIKKLVYISCNPDGHATLGNFVDLCRRPSLRIKGAPFSPVTAIPVDLFPHTKHCELVILFQRSKSTPSGEPT